jgi:hypothetical protein
LGPLKSGTAWMVRGRIQLDRKRPAGKEYPAIDGMIEEGQEKTPLRPQKVQSRERSDDAN